MVPVARRNLLSEKTRFAISVSGVAFAVLLILIVLSLYRGWSHSGQVFEDLPGQLWVVQEGTSDPFHSTSLLEPDELLEAQSTEGVLTVVPVLSRQMNFSPGGHKESVRLMALGVPDSADPVGIQTQYLPPEGQIIIEQILSRKTGLDAGDTLEINGVPLTVGKVRPAGGDVLSQFAFVNFQDARRIFGVADVVNYGMLILTNPVDAGKVTQSIETSDPRLQVYTSKEFAQSVRKEIDESFIPIILILVFIGFIVGSAVVGLTIYTATIERSREFGVMKATGASSAFLYRIVLSQAAMLTLTGFMAGVVSAVLTADIAQRAVPEFATDFQVRDLLGVLAAAVLMGAVASIVPVRRINSIDPASVFKA